MPESFWEWLAGGLATLYMLVMSWLGKRQVDRIDELYNTKANKSSTDKRFDDLMRKVEKQTDELGETNKALSELVGEMRNRREGAP